MDVDNENQSLFYLKIVDSSKGETIHDKVFGIINFINVSNEEIIITQT
jgi:hypothetical protein